MKKIVSKLALGLVALVGIGTVTLMVKENFDKKNNLDLDDTDLEETVFDDIYEFEDIDDIKYEEVKFSDLYENDLDSVDLEIYKPDTTVCEEEIEKEVIIKEVIVKEKDVNVELEIEDLGKVL